MSRGTLYGVSVGPGDPELITLKAIRTIREADVIAVPDSGSDRHIALAIARDYVEGKELLICAMPMSHSEAALKEAHAAAARDICAALEAGKSVAYLCLGDVSVYSTFSYVQALVKEQGYATEAIPGVTSFCAAAARLGTPLCTGSECLVVAPTSRSDLDAALALPGTTVFMKPGRSLAALHEELAARGLGERARVVSHVGMQDERVYEDLEAMDDAVGYLSLVIV